MVITTERPFASLSCWSLLFGCFEVDGYELGCNSSVTHSVNPATRCFKDKGMLKKVPGLWSIPLLQEAWAPLLPCLRCCALYRSQNEDLHKWTQSTNQTTVLLPVQAQVCAGPKVCRPVGPFGVSLQKRFSTSLSRCILRNSMLKPEKQIIREWDVVLMSWKKRWIVENLMPLKITWVICAAWLPFRANKEMKIVVQSVISIQNCWVTAFFK